MVSALYYLQLQGELDLGLIARALQFIMACWLVHHIVRSSTMERYFFGRDQLVFYANKGSLSNETTYFIRLLPLEAFHKVWLLMLNSIQFLGTLLVSFETSKLSVLSTGVVAIFAFTDIAFLYKRL